MLCDYWHKEWKYIPFSGAELPIKDDTGIRGFQFLEWHLGWDVHSGEFNIATSPHLTSKSFGWNPAKKELTFQEPPVYSMLTWSSNWHQTCRCSLNQTMDIGISDTFENVQMYLSCVAPLASFCNGGPLLCRCRCLRQGLWRCARGQGHSNKIY